MSGAPSYYVETGGYVGVADATKQADIARIDACLTYYNAPWSWTRPANSGGWYQFLSGPYAGALVSKDPLSACPNGSCALPAALAQEYNIPAQGLWTFGIYSGVPGTGGRITFVLPSTAAGVSTQDQSGVSVGAIFKVIGAAAGAVLTGGASVPGTIAAVTGAASADTATANSPSTYVPGAVPGLPANVPAGTTILGGSSLTLILLIVAVMVIAKEERG